MTMNKQWINDIRQKMEHYEADVPNGLYEDIQREMERRGLKPMAGGTRKPQVLPIWAQRVVVSAISAAAIAIVAILVLMIPTTERQSIASLPKSGNKLQSANVVTAKNIQYDEQESLVATMLQEGKVKIEKHSADQLLADNNVEATSVSYNNDIEPECEVKEQQQTPVQPKVTKPSSSTDTKKKYDYSLYSAVRHSHLVTLGAYVQGVQENRQKSAGAAMGYLASSDPIYGDGNKLDPNSPVQLPTAKNNERVHHKMPVKGGISLRYAIDDRWSVQTGINYSYHSSEIEVGEQHIDQKLHFVGVPVAIGYNVWSNRKVNVYLTTGAEMEKMVKGHRTVTYTGQHRDEDVKMSSPQFSAQFSAGAEYCASKAVSVYVEPNVSYHFDNGSNISTIYKDKPLELGFGMGVRITVGR